MSKIFVSYHNSDKEAFEKLFAKLEEVFKDHTILSKHDVLGGKETKGII